MIICYTVPQIRYVTDVTVIHFGPFFAILPSPPPPPLLWFRYNSSKFHHCEISIAILVLDKESPHLPPKAPKRPTSKRVNVPYFNYNLTCVRQSRHSFIQLKVIVLAQKCSKQFTNFHGKQLQQSPFSLKLQS